MVNNASAKGLQQTQGLSICISPMAFSPLTGLLDRPGKLAHSLQN